MNARLAPKQTNWQPRAFLQPHQQYLKYTKSVKFPKIRAVLCKLGLHAASVHTCDQKGSSCISQKERSVNKSSHLVSRRPPNVHKTRPHSPQGGPTSGVTTPAARRRPKATAAVVGRRLPPPGAVGGGSKGASRRWLIDRARQLRRAAAADGEPPPGGGGRHPPAAPGDLPNRRGAGAAAAKSLSGRIRSKRQPTGFGEGT